MVNAELGLRAVVQVGDLPWVSSADAGVEVRTIERFSLLERRLGTALLRFAPRARLASAAEGACEEVLVLAGELRDDRDVYQAGAFVHSPPGSQHLWHSSSGATVLYKTRPTGDHDRDRVVVHPEQHAFRPSHSAGLNMMVLCELWCSRVVLLRFAPGTKIDDHGHVDGEEFYIIEGALEDELGSYPSGTWVRQPPGSRHRAAAPDGCLMWTIAGHLSPPLLAAARR
jgi:anti-sigma factor ChrR (cupin superfamily)